MTQAETLDLSESPAREPLCAGAAIKQVRRKLETSFPTATAAVKLLEELSIVAELTGQKKNRTFSYAAYVAPAWSEYADP